MIFNGFFEGSYNPSARTAGQQTTNWFVETNPDGSRSLIRTPGRKLFCNPGFGNAAVRATYSLDGHMYAVVGNRVIEVFANGTCTVFDGTIVDDNNQANIAGNPTQLFITSGGYGYILSGTLKQISHPDFPTGSALGAAMIDQYFITGIRGTNTFAISSIGDGLVWNELKRGSAEATPDAILQIGALGNELWPFGSSSVQVFNDTGDFDFPFEPRQDILIPTGIHAPHSLIEAGGAWYYISGNNKAQMVVRASAYQLQPISTFGIQNTISEMSRSDDAIGWTYDENGHIFCCWLFPAANKTLCYDISTDMWHGRTWFNLGVENAHRVRSACSVFGKTIVGDRLDGKLYELSLNHLDDAGDLIRRVRRAPVLKAGMLGIVHSNFVLDGDMGIGLDGISDVDNQSYDPKVVLRWSNDNGNTWSNEHARGFGMIGAHPRRAIWRGLGYATRRVYEVSVTAPVEWALTYCGINENI